MTDRNTNLERLLKHAADAERFATWVDGGVDGGSEAAPVSPRGSSSLRWWIGGSAAAAAAVALGVVFLRPAPAPVAPRPIAIKPTPHVEIISTDAEPSITPTSAVANADLSDWFHLAPDAEDGIPSLTDDRSVLLAVYPGQDTSCGCVSWRLADDARFSQAGTQVLAEAVNSPCRQQGESVTVYAVSGPRYLLPFHEEDARRLAQCLATAPEDCVAPDTALDRIAQDSTDSSLPDLAASALAMCVPSGLTVTNLSIR